MNGHAVFVVSADRTRCCGSGNCVSLAPETFDQDDEGVVVVRQERPDAGLRPVLEQAVVLCPVQAIRLGSDSP